MATLFVDKVDPQSGTSLEIGSSGDTITIPSGCTITNNGTQSGFGGVNTPAFEAYRSSNQTISDNTATKIQFDTEVYDTAGNYDNSSNYRFTPSVAGKYYVSNTICVAPDSNMQYITASIYKNGSRIAQSLKGFNNTDPIGNNYFSVTVNIIADANGSSDYFEAYAYLHQDGDFRSTSRENVFLGYKIIGA